MSAKKAATKHADPKHHEAKDLRRSYEHLGRVDILQPFLKAADAKDVHALVELAEQQLKHGHRKEAADLLRAAEHLSFAALADMKSKGVSAELIENVTEEVAHLTQRASEHWTEQDGAGHHSSVAALFQSTLKAAAAALNAERYLQALELARGAEALAHAKKHGPDKPKLDQPRLDKPKGEKSRLKLT